MPRDFFKELAVFTILKKREYPESKLLPRPVQFAMSGLGRGGDAGPVKAIRGLKDSCEPTADRSPFSDS
jgi:hypothetical protein